MNDEHELWILGTLTPAPASIQWNSDDVVALVSNAQEVLWEPYYSVNVKSNFFQKLSLGYGMMKAEKNPDSKSLKDVLDSPLYARWVRVKARYMPSNRRIENKRPLVAADELLHAAIQQAGLSNRSVVNGPVLEAIRTHGVKSNAPRITVNLSNAAAKTALADVRSTSLNDVACLSATLDAIEQDFPHMITNANSWAKGDLDRINFTKLEHRNKLCADAITDADFARKHGLPNIQQSITSQWLQEAEAALRRNQVTLAIAPIENLLGPDGYIAQLRTKGYTVVNP